MNHVYAPWWPCPGDGGGYSRLARVMAYSAKSHNPGWQVHTPQLPGHDLRSKVASSAADNVWKLQHWRDFVIGLPDGDQVLLCDSDMLVVGPLDAVWDDDFDVAYCLRPRGFVFPLNGGLVAVRVGPAARAFMREWCRRDLAMLRDMDFHMLWRKKYGGQNQASLGCLLEEWARPAPLVVGTLPCEVWNCEDACWKDFGPATRVVHIKSHLRLAALGKTYANSPGIQPLASLWRRYEQHAVAFSQH